MNPVVAALRNRVSLIGDQAFGAKVIMGLRAARRSPLPIERSPFVVGEIRRERTMPDTVSILDGNKFVVSDRRGDIDATPTDTQGCSSTTRASCRGGS